MDNKQLCIVGLGSNMANRKEELKAAFAMLKTYDEDALLSPIYESEAKDMDENTPPFLNAVAAIKTGLEPMRLLEHFQHHETERGRQRADRYIDRPIDLDILFYGAFAFNTPRLQVPHPRMRDRKFVLAPLRDLFPGFFFHHLEKEVEEILNLCLDKSKTKRVHDSL